MTGGNNFTNKSQDALMQAQQLAQKKDEFRWCETRRIDASLDT